VDSKHRAEKQIRLVLAMYRFEVRRRGSDETVRFRDRAREIFDNLAAEISDDPELMTLLQEARRELRPEPRSPRGGLGEHGVDDGGQLGSGEGFG
jgi:hypothetical protein